MNLAEKIRILRDKNGLTQKEFAEKGQLSEAMVRGIEAGSRQPSIPVLENLLKGVGSSLAEFFESRIPTRYENSEHQDLHEKLQLIFDEDGDEAEWISGNIKTFHKALFGPGRPHETQKKPGSPRTRAISAKTGNDIGGR